MYSFNGRLSHRWPTGFHSSQKGEGHETFLKLGSFCAFFFSSADALQNTHKPIYYYCCLEKTLEKWVAHQNWRSEGFTRQQWHVPQHVGVCGLRSRNSALYFPGVSGAQKGLLSADHASVSFLILVTCSDPPKARADAGQDLICNVFFLCF